MFCVATFHCFCSLLSSLPGVDVTVPISLGGCWSSKSRRRLFTGEIYQWSDMSPEWLQEPLGPVSWRYAPIGFTQLAILYNSHQYMGWEAKSSVAPVPTAYRPSGNLLIEKPYWWSNLLCGCKDPIKNVHVGSSIDHTCPLEKGFKCLQ